ncbi:MAG: DUF2254 family protein [bacterium]
MNPTSKAPSGAAFKLLLGVVGAAVGVLIVAILADIGMHDLSPSTMAATMWAAGANRTLDGLPEVLSAVLGISLTVVAIVVQLASQRYPAKIVDVFMVDRINIGVFAFMASSCVYVVLASGANVDGQLPMVSIVALLLAVANFGMLLPYFAHVFAFLEPTNLISEIQGQAWSKISRVNDAPQQLTRTREVVASALDRIADNCMAALSQSDRNLAVHSVQTLEAMTRDYSDIKAQLPPQWHAVDASYFGTLANESIEDLIEHRTWFEAKALMEFERLIRRALDEMSEVVSQIARSTRLIARSAIAHNDWASVELCVRFFNTYIRHGLNRKNVRAVYNILYEYRLFAVSLLDARPELAQRVVEHLVYYGRTANEIGLPFVTVTVAHDVRMICQAAFERGDTHLEQMLELFLRLDQPVDGKGVDVALIGVRKAQSILGAYLIRGGAADLADQIRDDMRGERSDRLKFIRDEILAVSEQKFWEITDRGFNFDYTPAEDHPSIEEFFAPMLG